MRVMTFNLRFENDTDGDNAWVFRRELAAAVISRWRPDILGTQEGKRDQLLFLAAALPEYGLYMPGREMDETIQCPTLFFRKSSVKVLDGGEFWLSETPGVRLSKSWDSAFPRMMSWARVSMVQGRRRFITAVTHLDHLGAVARLEQGSMMAHWVNRQTLPVVLMGDFNDAPGSPVHELLTRSRLHDAWLTAGKKDSQAFFTRHRFDGVPRVARLDWILTDKRFCVKGIWIVHDRHQGRYPSDHFPVVADMEMISPEKRTGAIS